MPSILIVEDDALVRKTVISHLAKRGFAKSGQVGAGFKGLELARGRDQQNGELRGVSGVLRAPGGRRNGQ